MGSLTKLTNFNNVCSVEIIAIDLVWLCSYFYLFVSLFLFFMINFAISFLFYCKLHNFLALALMQPLKIGEVQLDVDCMEDMDVSD